MKMKTVPSLARRFAAFALFLAIALPSATALALPEVGSPRPDLRLADAWDRSINLGRYAGMPMLVLYENKGSAQENDALKKELAVLAKSEERYKKVVALVAVADVSQYDYWPVRGFAKSAIRKESSKNGIAIYCDWDGGVGGALGMRRNASNVVLYGKDGRVLFAKSGTLATSERAEMIGLLRQQIDGAAALAP